MAICEWRPYAPPADGGVSAHRSPARCLSALPSASACPPAARAAPRHIDPISEQVLSERPPSIRDSLPRRTMPSSARLFQLLIVVLFTGSAFVWLVPSSSKVILRPSAWSSHSESASIGPEDLSRLYEEHRQARLKDYDPKADEDEFRYRGLDPSLEAYVLRLRTFVLEAFPSHLHPPLLRSIERVERQLPPDPSRPEISRKIYTTNKDKNDVPKIFNEWKKLHESWTIDVLDDEGMDDWVEGYFGKGGAANEMGFVWRALPKIVLKSDTLRFVQIASRDVRRTSVLTKRRSLVCRYLIMLLEGGVYSDSDTMPTSPVLNWGHDYDAQRIVDLPLKLLSNLHSGLVDSNFHGHDSHADADALKHPLSDPTVSGVVGIEIDITRSTEPDFVKHWFARLVQFTQWTLAVSRDRTL